MTQSNARVSGCCRHPSRQANDPRPRHPPADPRGLRREGLPHDDLQERPLGRESGIQAEHLHVRSPIVGGNRVLQPFGGGDRPRLSLEACPKTSACHDSHFVEEITSTRSGHRKAHRHRSDRATRINRKISGTLGHGRLHQGEGRPQPILVRALEGGRFEIMPASAGIRRRRSPACDVADRGGCDNRNARISLIEPSTQGPDTLRRGGRLTALRPVPYTRGDRQEARQVANGNHRGAQPEPHARDGPGAMSAGRH